MSEKKVKRHEYFMIIGFCMIVFFAGAMDSENLAIPAAGLIVGMFTTVVSTWLYYRS